MKKFKNRRERMRRTKSLGGRRSTDTIFKSDNSESMASLALVGLVVVVLMASLLVINS